MGKVATIARRTFLVGSVAIAGGVAFGVYQVRKALPNPLKARDGEIIFNPYVVITQDGVTVVTPRAEMGQGVHSTLAALVAEELDVPWQSVRAEHGPASATYFNGTVVAAGLPFADYSEGRMKDMAKGGMHVLGKIMGIQITGGSTSAADAFETMRRAGAAARLALIEAAARRLGQPTSTLATKDGYVVARDGRTLSYASLAADAAQITPVADPQLKPRSAWRYLGTSMPRLDMAAKVDGSAQFGIDVRLPGMLYATVRVNPRLGGRMISFDAAKAEKMPGVKKILSLGDGIGVIATSTWRAMRAADAVTIVWGDAPYAKDSTGLLHEIGNAFTAGANSTLRDDGDAGSALAKGGSVEAEYGVPYLAHACMEPMNATALFKEGRLEIWTGNQAPTLIRDQAAKIAGLAPDAVTVYTPLMGGGFGRRAEFDVSNQAVRLAMVMPGTPIKLTWSREEDMRHDFYRPAAIARMKGVASSAGPSVLTADIAAPSVLRMQSQRALGFSPPGPDKILVEGAYDQPYAIANYRVRGFISNVAVPVGAWRSVGNSHNAFFHECFLDELAVAAKIDPVAMRLSMMKGVHEPSRKVVEAVAEMASWGKTLPAGKGRGMAFTMSFGTPTAEIVEISSTPQGLRIDKVWCAIDVGTALDPRNIEAQVMSGIVFGLSAAVTEGISFKDGAVVEGNFNAYDPLRLYQCPVVETRILENNRHISGVGEPGTPPAAPALANAVFNLTGKRIRELPLSKHVAFA